MFSYPTGRAGAVALGYDAAILDKIPDDDLRSFCGVGNPFSLSPLGSGASVLDVGCGVGIDLIVARRYVGSKGRVCGIDLTEEMVNRAQALLERLGDDHFTVQRVTSETIPFADETFDYVISNGVINLSPAKLRLFKEIHRVLNRGGTLQFADVLLKDEQSPGPPGSLDDWAQ